MTEEQLALFDTIKSMVNERDDMRVLDEVGSTIPAEPPISEGLVLEIEMDSADERDQIKMLITVQEVVI